MHTQVLCVHHVRQARRVTKTLAKTLTKTLTKTLAKTLATAVVLASAFVLLASRAHAQASPYVPLDDIAYRYADALIARGETPYLATLERPYTARELSTASAIVLSTSHSAMIRSYALALQTALARYGSGTADQRWQNDPSEGRLFINGDVFGTGQTSGIRELMQADTSNSVTGGAGVRIGFTAGSFVAMLHPVMDNQLNNDPQFGGRKDRKVAGRTNDAYVGGQWTYVQLFLGRTARTWGPYALQGLQLGNAPYSYDHLYARFGSEKIHVTSMVAKLDDSFQSDGVHARYFYTHRLAGRWKGLELGASEGYVASGIGRSFDLSLANPANVYALSWRNEQDDGNLNIGADVALRTRRFGIYSAELFVDDWQVDNCDSTCHEPSSYGLTASAEGIPLFNEQRLFASYTRLTGLAYRTPNEAEQYSSFGIGLGRPFTDYDETRVGVDLAVVPYATLRVYGAYRRQGEGDYHLPFPARTSYATTVGFLSGVVERVTRVGVDGGMMIGPGVELTGDGGYNRVTNASHVNGMTRSTFEGRIRLQWTPKGWFGTL
jgi:hypothetical protein